MLDNCDCVHGVSCCVVCAVRVNGVHAGAGISGSMEGLGRAVARRPYLVISLSVIFAVVWGTVFACFSVENRRIETLYTPKDAQSMQDKAYTLAEFGQPPQEVVQGWDAYPFCV